MHIERFLSRIVVPVVPRKLEPIPEIDSRMEELSSIPTQSASRDRSSRRRLISDYKLISTLGVGSYGHVILCSDGTVLKVIRKSKFNADPLQASIRIKQVTRECNFLTRLNSPSIQKAIEIFEDSANLYIRMNFCQGGDLCTHIDKDRIRNFACVQFYARETIIALEYLHKKGIIHRDVKPENLMLDGGGHVILGDFGLAIQGNVPGGTPPVGSVAFVAREMIEQKRYGTEVDIWSLGMTLLNIRTGQLPFVARDKDGIFAEILKGVTCPDTIEELARDFIQRCLSVSEVRIGKGKNFREIKWHPFVACNWIEAKDGKLIPPFVPGDYDAAKPLENFDRYLEPKGVIGDSQIEAKKRPTPEDLLDPLFDSLPLVST